MLDIRYDRAVLQCRMCDRLDESTLFFPEGVKEWKHHRDEFICDPLRGRIFFGCVPGVVVTLFLDPGLMSLIPLGSEFEQGVENPFSIKKATTLSDRGFWEIVSDDYFLSTLSLLTP
jgi:hypothetical protein